MTLQKIIKIAVIIIGLIAIFFLVRIMMLGDEAIEADPANQGVLSSFATLAYIVLGIAAISALVFSLINLLTNPDKLKRSLLSIGVFVAIIAIAYFLSTGGEPRTLDNGDILTSSDQQWIEAGIKTFYILILVAGGLMLFFGVKKTLSR